MAHFGVLSHSGTGHLNPLIALSKKLVSRGHKVTLFQHPGLEQRVREQGLAFLPIEIPRSTQTKPLSLKTTDRESASLHAEIRYRLSRTIAEMEAYLSAYPSAIQATDVDALILGEISLAGPTVAELLRLPYFIVSTSIPHNFGWETPQAVVPSRSRSEELQKRFLEVSILNMHGPIRRSLDRHRRHIGLGPICRIGETFPELAHITQWPECLDISRSDLPANFFYAGPFIDPTSRAAVEFPWERLDQRPLVYASLGTTLRGDPAIFDRIAEVCHELDLQLVISIGRRRDPTMFTGLAGDPIVVQNAPQLELLQTAVAVITHAGPNTVLETLMQGKPMVALPIALDQPAVATHLARLGVAEVLSTEDRSAQKILAALTKVINDPGYRHAAMKIQTRVISFSGVARAAEIIEDKLTERSHRCNDQGQQDCVSARRFVMSVSATLDHGGA